MFAAALVLVCLSPLQGMAAAPPRVDLKVLVVTDGTPWVEATRAQLELEGVPTTTVNLADSGRPTITGSFLASTLADGTPHAHFQGVVLSGDAPSGLSADELSALATFETAFSVRQVDGYVYPNANVGMNPPDYAGTLDGVATTVTSAARSAGFGYLAGAFKLEDNDPNASESYGFLGQPLPNDPATDATFTPYLTATIPGTNTQATLAGVYSKGRREQLEVSFGYNGNQLQYRYLAHGIVDWVTRGVHFGYWRNYFSVHIDDIFSYDARWSDIGKCSPGDGVCPPGTPDTTPIRMTPADASYSAQWQQQNNFTLDLLFNGGASEQYVADNNKPDPLLAAYQPIVNQFRWVNHTYTHPFLGCVQDFTVIPWRCATDANGDIRWVSLTTINNEITRNTQWAKSKNIPTMKPELVSGEHSGTKILPQQPVDNPNFVTAMGQTGIKWLGLDASREPAQRPVGAALGLPRHPINVFYNVSTEADEVSEYNWIYTSKANGGSGICESTPGTSCIEPLNPATGWSSYILPKQIQITLAYVLQNDPRPFYMHQSNLIDDKLAYGVVGGVLSAYRGVYTADTPVVNVRMTDAGQALQLQAGWAQTQAQGTVSGYVQGNTVTLLGPSGAKAPATVPVQTRRNSANGQLFGSAYAGERSDYITLGSTPTKLILPSTPYLGS
jgi:hypothetical protein